MNLRLLESISTAPVKKTAQQPERNSRGSGSSGKHLGIEVTSGRWRIAALNKHDKPRVGSGASNITKEMVVEKFSTHKVNLSDINKAFDYMIRGKAQRHRHRCLGKANTLEA
ncbi:hypothetical protein ACET3Z_009592 [Daucus carota]